MPPPSDLIRAARSSPLFAPAVRLAGVQVVLALVKGFAPLSPRERAPVAAGDLRLAHALVAEEQVSGAMLVVFAALIPTLLVIYATPPDGLRAARVLALGEALALAEAVTMILKAIAGRPRPIYYALIAEGSSEARRSFPSGHSSCAAAGLGFASLALGGAPRVHGRAIGLALALAPSLLALWVGVTRIQDHWHWPTDVAAGLAIGSGAAAASFRRFAKGSKPLGDLAGNRGEPHLP